MRGRATGVALPALAILLLVAVVAVASSGSTPGGSAQSRRPSDSLLDAFFTLWILAAIAGGVLLVYGLTQRKAIAVELSSGRYRRVSVVAWVGLVLVAVLIAAGARRLGLERHPRGAVEEAPPLGGGPIPPIQGQTPSAQYEPGISWPVVVLVAGLVVAAVVAFLLSQRRSPRHDEVDLAEQLAAALDDAVDDLRNEADARRAIVAAYARMERALGASGVPRRTAETPDEYLARVLSELAPESDAVSRLTRLFTQAKFSHHVVDATMKEEAIDALESVRDELRPHAPDSVTSASETLAGVRS